MVYKYIFIYIVSGTAEKSPPKTCESSWGVVFDGDVNGGERVRMNENHFGTMGPCAGGAKTDTDALMSYASIIHSQP